MDPVTVGAVVLAIVSGAAGEASGRLWDGLRRLVRRSPEGKNPTAAVLDGMAELVALEQDPTNDRAVVLAEALVARANADMVFRQELETWWAQASQSRSGPGDVTSTISGGTQHGPVLQGRDFTDLTFHTGRIPQPSGE